MRHRGRAIVCAITARDTRTRDEGSESMTSLESAKEKAISAIERRTKRERTSIANLEKKISKVKNDVTTMTDLESKIELLVDESPKPELEAVIRKIRSIDTQWQRDFSALARLLEKMLRSESAFKVTVPGKIWQLVMTSLMSDNPGHLVFELSDDGLSVRELDNGHVALSEALIAPRPEGVVGFPTMALRPSDINFKDLKRKPLDFVEFSFNPMLDEVVLQYGISGITWERTVSISKEYDPLVEPPSPRFTATASIGSDLLFEILNTSSDLFPHIILEAKDGEIYLTPCKRGETSRTKPETSVIRPETIQLEGEAKSCYTIRMMLGWEPLISVAPISIVRFGNDSVISIELPLTNGCYFRRFLAPRLEPSFGS